MPTKAKTVYMKVIFSDESLRQKFKVACVSSNVSMNEQTLKLLDWVTRHWETTGKLPDLPDPKDVDDE